MDQRLIGPGVVEGRGHVHITIRQNEQRPLKAGEEKCHETQTLSELGESEHCIMGSGVSV